MLGGDTRAHHRNCTHDYFTIGACRYVFLGGWKEMIDDVIAITSKYVLHTWMQLFMPDFCANLP